MKSLTSLLLVACSVTAHAQLFEESDKILALGKDSVVQLAVAQLEKSGFTDIDPTRFDWLKVRTNGQEIQVIFDRSIQYFPRDTFVIHAATVEIMYGHVGCEPRGIENDPAESRKFYSYTANDKKALDFVMAHIHTAPGSRLIINESEDYYSVSEITQYWETGFKVEKLTGNVKDKWHAQSGAGSGKIDDGFKEVDW
ncbi:MAG: hypothetical protein RIF36_22800 [Imperialibacter sp.]|uniref:hypothetical protein n=1 Tax=Imperialibacter sp. TaxID=2038411 RepID=UPI0032EB10FB